MARCNTRRSSHRFPAVDQALPSVKSEYLPAPFDEADAELIVSVWREPMRRVHGLQELGVAERRLSPWMHRLLRPGKDESMRYPSLPPAVSDPRRNRQDRTPCKVSSASSNCVFAGPFMNLRTSRSTRFCAAFQ